MKELINNPAALAGYILTVLNILIILSRPIIKHFKEFSKRRTYLQNDYVDIQDLQEGIYYLQVCVLLMLNHFIEGNGIEEMKKTRNDMQEKMFKKPTRDEDRK